MAKYRKKPVVIDAVRWIPYEMVLSDVLDELGIEEFNDVGVKRIRKCDNNTRIIIETLEGNMVVAPEDYIIKGVNGEIYPCKPGIFEKTYEKVNYNSTPEGEDFSRFPNI